MNQTHEIFEARGLTVGSVGQDLRDNASGERKMVCLWSFRPSGTERRGRLGNLAKERLGYHWEIWALRLLNASEVAVMAQFGISSRCRSC